MGLAGVVNVLRKGLIFYAEFHLTYIKQDPELKTLPEQMRKYPDYQQAAPSQLKCSIKTQLGRLLWDSLAAFSYP